MNEMFWATSKCVAVKILVQPFSDFDFVKQPLCELNRICLVSRLPAFPQILAPDKPPHLPELRSINPTNLKRVGVAANVRQIEGSGSAAHA
jgi:hypothetical protein